jgi:hypothetical protein
MENYLEEIELTEKKLLVLKIKKELVRVIKNTE